MINRRSFIGFSTLAMAAIAGNRFGSAFAESNGKAGATVSTNSGKVRGLRLGHVQAFKGVPYGASTAGNARFMPPTKPMPWAGVRDMFELGPRAPQNPARMIPEFAVADRQEPMGEDCLVLNIWTPNARSNDRRPVIVWLHGGGFSTGSGGFTIWDGTNLAAKHDVVVITLNHRLNVFGFLFLADLGGPQYANSSNIGMLDIVAALEWVRDNISEFGGDPGNITIFGPKVSTVMAMPSAKGLYHRVITESGGSSTAGLSRDAANRVTEAFMTTMGLKVNDVDKLQDIPVKQILTAMEGGGAGANVAARMMPVVDGHTLPVNPSDPAAPGMSADVPFLVGSTQNEVAFNPGTQLDSIDDEALHGRVKQALRSSDADAVIAAYRADQPGISDIDIAIEVSSDVYAWENALTQAERKAALGKAPAYMFYFTWKSPVREGKLKAFHTLEIPFAFNNVDVATSMTGNGHDRYALEERISSAWVAFARTGNPSVASLPNWPAFDTEQRATMFLDDDCKVVNDPRHHERLALIAARTGS